MTQIKAILEHLQTHGSITSNEAFKLYGATRLSAIIYILRDKGYEIQSTSEKGKTRYGHHTTYARYILRGCNK